MTGTPGRPLSAELSEQLISVAVDILAEEGWGRLNSDRIAARARAGKAGIYRRWPTMAALARSAVSRFDLVSAPSEGSSVREDLFGLVARWTSPLDREERAVASIVGAARHEEDLRAGLDDALVRPLARAVARRYRSGSLGSSSVRGRSGGRPRTGWCESNAVVSDPSPRVRSGTCWNSSCTRAAGSVPSITRPVGVALMASGTTRKVNSAVKTAR